MWEDSREEGSPPVDHFFPIETKAASAAEFESLKQGSMRVWEYHMRFARLSKYAIYMLPTMETRVRRFVHGLRPLVINEAATAALNSDLNYSKMVVFAQAIETHKLKNKMERERRSKVRSACIFGGSSGGGVGGRSVFRGRSLGPSQSFAQSSVSAPPSGPGQQQGNHFRPSQGNKGSYQHGQSGGRFHQHRRPPCPRCRKMHFGVYRDYVVTVRGQDTMVDLIELGMVDFDEIMGMAWLYSCFA
nr:uncharacterized protein LOC117278793 [Nicotiana tomentosiformis]